MHYSIYNSSHVILALVTPLMIMKNFIFYGMQFLLLFYIFLSGPIFIFSIPFVLIEGFSILLIFWAFLVKKLYKYSASSRVPKRVYLVTEGPYEIIRHPIYAGLLLFVSTYVQEYFTGPRFLALLVFVVIILVQIHRDEELTESYFKHKYNEYKKKTKKLIPYIY